MNSILDFIYALFFGPSDVFLYISLFLITASSLWIIIRQSRRISQLDLEASSAALVPRQTQVQHEPLQQRYHDDPYDAAEPTESETAPTEHEEETYQDRDQTRPDSPQTSHTSTSIHNTPPLNVHPPQVVVIGSQQDSLIETGSLFANDNNQNSYNSSPLVQESDHESDGSTSSLDLSE